MRKEAAITTSNTDPAADAAPSKTAVTYLRVSTVDQATRGGREEGFSIPAQRDANTRKAASLDAVVVAEFVDAGESGTSATKRLPRKSRSPGGAAAGDSSTNSAPSAPSVNMSWEDWLSGGAPTS